MQEFYNVHYSLSNHKYLINSNQDFSEVVDLGDPRQGTISYSVSKEKDLAERSEELFLKKTKKSEKADFYSRKFAETMGYPDCCVEFGDRLSGNLANEELRRKNLI